MILKNKTNMFQSIAGKTVRPWRDVSVDDSVVEFDDNVFEIVGEKKKKEKKVDEDDK